MWYTVHLADAATRIFLAGGDFEIEAEDVYGAAEKAVCLYQTKLDFPINHQILAGVSPHSDLVFVTVNTGEFFDIKAER